MNIFYLDEDPIRAARYHNDRHTVKMILESAQLLSTAHRLLDGSKYTESVNNKKLKRWSLSDKRETKLYKAAFFNHPCAVWVRENSANYRYTANLLYALCKEYTYRYDKIHKVERTILPYLLQLPKNITHSNTQTPPYLAMPVERVIYESAVENYRNYYLVDKSYIGVWTKREIPEWWTK